LSAVERAPNEVHCLTGDAIQGNIERVVKARKELGIT